MLLLLLFLCFWWWASYTMIQDISSWLLHWKVGILLLLVIVKNFSKVKIIVGQNRTCWIEEYFWKNNKNIFKILKFSFTNPSPCFGEVLLFVEDRVEDEKNREGGVVSYDSLSAGELSIIHHIEPGGKKNNPWNAVKNCLEEQE